MGNTGENRECERCEWWSVERFRRQDKSGANSARAWDEPRLCGSNLGGEQPKFRDEGSSKLQGRGAESTG